MVLTRDRELFPDGKRGRFNNKMRIYRIAGIPRRGPYLYGLLKETGPVAVRLTKEEWDQSPTHGQFFGDAWMRGIRWTYNASDSQLQFMMTPTHEEYQEIRTWVENNGFSVKSVVYLKGSGFRTYNQADGYEED